MAEVAPSPPPVSKPVEAEDRAERVLKALARICQHDLPNQLVVFQGLLHLLETEEQANLSPQAFDYLGRLNSVTSKTLNLGRYVKELCRLVTTPAAIERIELPTLIEEVKAQSRHSFPEHALVWDASWRISHVTGDRQALTRALLELLGLTLTLSSGKTFHVLLQARAEDVQRLVKMAIRLDDTVKDPLPREPKIWQGRLEFVLARELLAGWGGCLSMTIDSGRDVNFLLALPG